MTITCFPLGAGQDIGKSCVIVTLGGKKIMFDCGMHMGYNDERRYPDFSFISKTGNFTNEIDCVIITHFHIDHIGALPHFTEICGYEGPIYMTFPTKALAPLMLEDHRKVMVDKKGEQDHYSSLHIQQCMKRVTAVNLRQTVYVGDGLEFRAYYAGHVLGAAMFYVKAGCSTVVYTGDYNMVPDRLLGAAQIDRLEPDLLITESTYATSIRDSKLAKEAEFLETVHSCVRNDGKVLIPTFALGRAQELCILLDEYWEQMNLKVPIYFSAGLTSQSNIYYKLLVSWTNQKVKDSFVSRNTFDFKHVSPFEKAQIDAPGPCVLFATPGMLNGGLSLEAFKRWAPLEQNMVIFPGFCISGTVGHKVLSGKTNRIEIDKRTHVDVRCQVQQLSFSAHTDAKGIMDLVRDVAPRNVVLVHGEAPKMAILKAKISSELGIPCFDPKNHEMVTVPSHFDMKVEASKELVIRSLRSGAGRSNGGGISVDAHVSTSPSSQFMLLHPSESHLPKVELSFKSEVEITVTSSEKLFSEREPQLQIDDEKIEPALKKLRMDLDLEKLPEEVEEEHKFVFDINEVPSTPSEEKPVSVHYDPEVVSKVMHKVLGELSKWIVGTTIAQSGDTMVECGNVHITFGASQWFLPARDGDQQRVTLLCAWPCEDNLLASRVLGILKKLSVNL